MPSADTLAKAIAPLTADPGRAGILLDVDGTLAPIVRHADDASVTEQTRSLLIEISRRFGLVACVSGRRASEARRIVSIGSITYVGNHGAEVLRGGGTEPELEGEIDSWAKRVQAFADDVDRGMLRRERIRFEDKGVIVAYHWRGAPDEESAEDALKEVAKGAERAGLHPYWGRKVLEIRPRVRFDKGTGVVALLRDLDLEVAMYVGDDTTDLDAFRGLRELLEEGHLARVVLVGVRSEETPAGIEREADLLVDGTEGVASLLQALIALR
ncbi:MAG: trehalose-phosphatase [Solirubrobacteraceae bacterium]